MVLEARGRTEREVWRTSEERRTGWCVVIGVEGSGAEDWSRRLEMRLKRGESGRNVQARSQAVTGSLREDSRIGIEWTWRGGGTVWVTLLEGRNGSRRRGGRR